MPGNGGINLGLQAGLLSILQGAKGAFERATDAAEAVVTRRVRPIETDRHTGYSTILEPFDGSFRCRRHRTRGDGGTQTKLHAPFQQGEEVGPFQGIAACEDHEGIAEGPDFLKQSKSLCGGQFEGISVLDRTSTAVHASEIASLGEFPNDRKGASSKFLIVLIALMS